MIDPQDIILWIHYLIIFIIISGPFILPTKIINYYIIFFITVIVHWYIMNGKCVISCMHESKKFSGRYILNTIFCNYNLSQYIYDISVYLLLFISFYRINKLRVGLIVIIMILILNKYIYHHYNFKWI